MTAQVLQSRQDVRRGANRRRDGFHLRSLFYAAALITILLLVVAMILRHRILRG
jgi:hypothetical protein